MKVSSQCLLMDSQDLRNIEDKHTSVHDWRLNNKINRIHER